MIRSFVLFIGSKPGQADCHFGDERVERETACRPLGQPLQAAPITDWPTGEEERGAGVQVFRDL